VVVASVVVVGVLPITIGVVATIRRSPLLTGVPIKSLSRYVSMLTTPTSAPITTTAAAGSPTRITLTLWPRLLGCHFGFFFLVFVACAVYE
jgi:hypothetical protein